MLDLLGIAKELKRLREESGLSQRAFAKKMQVGNAGKIVRLELSINKPQSLTLDVLYRWLLACDRDLITFLRPFLSAQEQEHVKVMDLEESELRKLFNRALRSPRYRRRLRRVFEILFSNDDEPPDTPRK